MFPSPTGVLYLLIRRYRNYKIRGEEVSVPYWGSLSSNTSMQSFQYLRMVSVPYWGSLSSNKYPKFQEKFEDEFPSPTGVLYLLIKEVVNIRKRVFVSVPYWGSLSSNPASANPVFMHIDYSLYVAKNIFIILIPKVIYNYQFVQ